MGLRKHRWKGGEVGAGKKVAGGMSRLPGDIDCL
jgi:hypothetical protein